MTVSEFYDIISLNEHNHLIIKNTKEEVIADIKKVTDFMKIENTIGQKQLYHLATHWEEKTYILWIE